MEINRVIGFLKCPYCNAEGLREEANKIHCRGCLNVFDIIEGVPILMKKENLGSQESKQLDWFDKHYSAFSKDTYKLENWRLSMLNRVLENSFKEKVNTYLDIGCGATGYTVIESARRNKWISFGMDISVEAAVRANYLAKKQGVGESTAFIVGSAETPPFKAGSLDYISAVSLLEHLEQDTKAMESFHKLLNNDGHLYICVPNTYKRIWPFLWPVFWYFDRKIGHKRHYSIEALACKMKKGNRFDIEDFFYNGHLNKFCQIFFDKLRIIDEKKWWEMENNDINKISSGVQLNAIFRKI